MKKTILLAAAVVATAMAAQATIYSTNWNNLANGFANAGMVPNNSISGWSDTRVVTTMQPGTLQGVAVNIQLASEWTGDLYAYLMNDAGLVVLLNRVGLGTGSGPTLTYGYDGANWNLTLASDGFNGQNYASEIQTIGNLNETGIYNPLGNLQNAGFLSVSPNGTWRLFVSDLSTGDISQVQGWGLQMDIVAVPEVESWIAAALAGAFGAFWLNRQIFGGTRS